MNVAEEIGAVIAEMRDKAVRLCNPPNFVDLSPIADWFDETADRLSAIRAEMGKGQGEPAAFLHRTSSNIIECYYQGVLCPVDGNRLAITIDLPLNKSVPVYRAAPPADSAQGEWKQALLEELIVDCIYTAEHETNPKKALQDAIEWNVRVALDPAVSADARKLIVDSAQVLVEALEKIASCESKWPGDVVDIARAALAAHKSEGKR